MERWMKKTVELAAGLALTGKHNPSVIPYYPQKTALPTDEEQYFTRSYPERVGVSSGRILALLRALERERRANIHNIIIVKDGVVISEASHPGYSVNSWHLSHSMSKTLTGIAVGMLVDDGRLSLDTRLTDIYPGINYRDKRFRLITVRHLLTMSTGVRFSEAGSVTESRWTEAFFESGLSFTPGTSFSYNSMNSYILAKIVCDLSGKSLTEFLSERLLKPLHITSFFWERGPEGIEKGGWGVYTSAESWAKVGYMMLSGGVFEGRRILSEAWIKESTARQIETPKSTGHYDYGYQLWSSKGGESYLFNGMLGQNVWVYPKNNIVVVVNSGNNEIFQNSPAMAVIEKYLTQDLSSDLTESCFSGDLVDLRRAEEHFFECRHWIRPLEERRGLGTRLGIRERAPYPMLWDDLVGKYHFRKNNLGMIPLFIRGMQNNLKNSIDGISFEREGESFYLSFSEGGSTYRMEIGFYDFKQTVLEYHGEKYIVKVIGEAMEDEDRNMLYKVELLFPEMPNTRMLKFSFLEEGQLLMRMSESPNNKIADLFFDDLPVNNPKLAVAFDFVEKRIGKNFARRKLEETFAPSLIGARIGAENYTEIMDREREKLRSGEKTVKLINAVISKLLHDEEDEDTEGEVGGLRGFIGDVVEKLRERLPRRDKEALPPTDSDS